MALGAAERRAADGGAEELAGRLAHCRADLALLRKLDDADTFRWTWTDRRSPPTPGPWRPGGRPPWPTTG